VCPLALGLSNHLKAQESFLQTVKLAKSFSPLPHMLRLNALLPFIQAPATSYTLLLNTMYAGVSL